MPELHAQLLAADPRIAEAKRILLETLAEHQRAIVGIRPADPALKIEYDKIIEGFNAVRGGSLYYPYLGSGMGRGPLVELADGSIKYDFISGIGVHYLGHGHPTLVAAGIDAALSDLAMQGNLQQNIESVSLCNALLDLARRGGKRLEHCFLTTSGAMANENALKMVFQKRAPADRILAFSHGFAGRTMALSQITDKPAFRVGLPTMLTVDYVPFWNPDHPGESTADALRVLNEHLLRYPNQHAAMWIELIQGEGGYYPGDRDFFKAMVETLKAHNVGVWIDEIQTFGRTTHPFAFQYFGLDEDVDVVTVGKLTQACATLFTEAYKPKPGLISQTFTASTSAIFAANAILDLLARGDYFGEKGRIARFSGHFTNRLQAIARRHPNWIKGPFGLGAMIACSIFDGGEEITRKFLRALFDNGVIAFVAGASPARVRFLMPVGAISLEDIDAVAAIIEKTLADVAV